MYFSFYYFEGLTLQKLKYKSYIVYIYMKTENMTIKGHSKY